MRVLIALGGNALLRRDESTTVAVQRRNAERAASVVAEIARVHEVVVTHGNGPQIGLLARQTLAARDRPQATPREGATEDEVGSAELEPLDALGAETEGLIGYLLALALRNASPEREIVSLLTQVEVDPEDPGFQEPTKPIGPVFETSSEGSLPMREQWRYARQRGGWRRVVASPEPQRILELATIDRLVAAGVLVVCGGGGGIPVVRTARGRLAGAEAVIDKDLTSALLAASLGCDRLLLLTDVDGIYRDWPETRQPVRTIAPDALRSLALDAGSMGPKAEAACRFVQATGGEAAIGRLEEGATVLRGGAGTRVRRGAHGAAGAGAPA